MMKNGELFHIDLHLGSGVGKANRTAVSDVNKAKPCEVVGRQGLGKRPQREDLLPKSWLSDTCGTRKISACFFASCFRACHWRCGGLPFINFVVDREKDDWKLWHVFGSLYVLWCFTPLSVTVVSGAWRTMLTHFCLVFRVPWIIQCARCQCA